MSCQCASFCSDEQHGGGNDADPVGSWIAPAPSTAILVAISASLGIPFVISTPPNAMVYGEGGIAFYDLSGTGTDSYGVGL